MTTQSRRSSVLSATLSSQAKRQASSSFSSSETARKVNATKAPSSQLAKKRAPLGNITNQKGGSRFCNSSPVLVPCANKAGKPKKPVSVGCQEGLFGDVAGSVKPTVVVQAKLTALPKNDGTYSSNPSDSSAPSNTDLLSSPSKSDSLFSSDDSMSIVSTCDSFNTPQLESLGNDDELPAGSVERKTLSNLNISEHVENSENLCSRDVLADNMELDNTIVNIDNNYDDPQHCAIFACDIYKHLRASEAKKRPSVDFMEKIQKDITPNMRTVLIDWLVEVGEEYRLVPDTLYLTVNYIDRYLSGNVMNRQRLQLLGVACMMIAAKYEEICAPQVEEFCYITDNTYFKDEVLDMESSVLNYLKFEMTAPTIKCFLRRFVRAAQGVNEAPSMVLECMANYISELSLLEYKMLRYAPSVIAASAIFVAKYILDPLNKPWNSTLQHYTLYKPSDLCDCIKDLHRLCLNSHASSQPAVRMKYSQHKYKFVAKKFCPPSIPTEFLKK